MGLTNNRRFYQSHPLKGKKSSPVPNHNRTDTTISLHMCCRQRNASCPQVESWTPTICSRRARHAVKLAYTTKGGRWLASNATETFLSQTTGMHFSVTSFLHSCGVRISAPPTDRYRDANGYVTNELYLFIRTIHTGLGLLIKMVSNGYTRLHALLTHAVQLTWLAPVEYVMSTHCPSVLFTPEHQTEMNKRSNQSNSINTY